MNQELVGAERAERVKRLTADVARLRANSQESARQARRDAAMQRVQDALVAENISIAKQLAARETELTELTDAD